MPKASFTSEQMQMVFDLMEEGVVEQDENSSVIFWNKASLRVLDITEEEMSGVTSHDPRWKSIREDGTDFPSEEHPVVQTIKTGKPLKNVIMGLAYEDGTRWIKINTSPHNVDGKTHCIATFSDITELIQQKKNLEEKNQELTIINKAMVSRELAMIKMKEKLKGNNPQEEPDTD